MPLKGEVGGHPLNSHGNYIVDRGKSWKNHGIVFLNFCGNHVCRAMICCERNLNAFIKTSSTQPRGPQTISGSINGNSCPYCLSEVGNKFQSGHEAITLC